jgi:hypothetical protein
VISAADYAPVIASTLDTTEWFALFDRELQ